MTLAPRFDTLTYRDHAGVSRGADVVVAQPPTGLLTSETNPRLRVDVGQTGFFEGREFRTFLEFSASQVIRVVVPINVILFNLSVSLTEGEVRVETVSGVSINVMVTDAS